MNEEVTALFVLIIVPMLFLATLAVVLDVLKQDCEESDTTVTQEL